MLKNMYAQITNCCCIFKYTDTEKTAQGEKRQYKKRMATLTACIIQNTLAKSQNNLHTNPKNKGLKHHKKQFASVDTD